LEQVLVLQEPQQVLVLQVASMLGTRLEHQHLQWLHLLPIDANFRRLALLLKIHVLS
jgi:hypothetical protein